MCGIAGYFLNKETLGSRLEILKVLESIRKRGPDDEGVCLISAKKQKYNFYKTEKTIPALSNSLSHIDNIDNAIEHDIALVHTRYAIIDLSEGGHQPFISHDGSVIAVFNGEIYNYIELRKELAALGVTFRTKSDTEVLVEGYRVWRDTLWQKMNGFWAVALYDFYNRTFMISRDRIGVAPLYYRELSNGFYFASTIQTLVDISPYNIEINEDVMMGFIQTGIKDHDNTTYYRSIKSVPAATAVTFPIESYKFQDSKKNTFWSLPLSRIDKKDYSLPEAIRDYRDTFFNAVELRLRADVKIAFELSGGLDSSSVVAAASLLGHNITTYTADVKGADELPYARSMLERYDIDFHVISRIENNFHNDYGEFSLLMNEPYDNPNDYTHNRMLNIMKLDGFKVVVTGAGGDEVFAGYESAFWTKVYNELRKKGIVSYFHADWYEFLRRFKTLKNLSQTMKHYAFDPFKFLYAWIFQRNRNIIKKQHPTTALKHMQRYTELSAHEQSLFHFKVGLLPYYMRSSDYFTMAIPIEHRFPLLDYRMVELGLKLPYEYLFNGSWTKYITRKAMEPYLPEKILWRRKKSGFYFPYQHYLYENRTTFEPLLSYLKNFNFDQETMGSYENLLKTDAVKLWRLISTAIWIKFNLAKL